MLLSGNSDDNLDVGSAEVTSGAHNDAVGPPKKSLKRKATTAGKFSFSCRPRFEYSHSDFTGFKSGGTNAVNKKKKLVNNKASGKLKRS